MDNPPKARRKESEIIQLLFSNRSIDELNDYLSEHPDLDIMALKDNQSNTILHQLAFEGHLDIMQLFVKEAKKRLHREKKRKLYQRDTQQEIANWMNTQNTEGFTALLYASYSGHLDIVRFLVEEYHVNTSLTTNTGLNPLHVAAQRNMVLPLLYFKDLININSVDTLQSTPLHWAAYMNSEAVVAFLLTEPGLTCLDQQDNDGNTPLMLAVTYGNTRVVRRLLIKGADRYVKNRSGKIPMDVALENNYQTIPKMLDEQYTFMDLIKFYCNLKLEYRPKKRKLTIPIVFLVALALNIAIINIFFHFVEWYPIYVETIALGTMTLLYLTLLRGPEPLEPKQYEELLRDKNQKQLKKLCFECKNYIPKRGYHCDICHTCISQYDHHCTWINNCVGKRNIGRFIFFLIFLILSLGFIGAVSTFGEICLLLDDTSYYEQWFTIRYQYSDTTERIISIAVIGVNVISALFIFPVLALFIMQIKNLLMNKTMYQSLRNPHEDQSPIKSKMKKYSSKVSMRNCQIMCSDNPEYLSTVQSDTDPYEQPLSEDKR